MITFFKDYLKSEEIIFRFDLLSLNQRCLEMLRKFQAVCVEQSPLVYPTREYGGDRNIVYCFSQMLELLGRACYLPVRFKESCLIVKETIGAGGSEEYMKAKSRCFIEGDGNRKVTDPFEAPFEDNLLFPDRAMFGRIVIMGDSAGNGFRMFQEVYHKRNLQTD